MVFLRFLQLWIPYWVYSIHGANVSQIIFEKGNHVKISQERLKEYTIDSWENTQKSV